MSRGGTTQAPPRRGAAAPDPGRGALAVVGDAGARTIARRALRHGAAEARDADEAAGLLLGPEGPRELRLVLVDLPAAAACDMLRRLRNDPRTRGIPVVILAGAPGAAEAHEAYALGANSCVAAPRDNGGYAETVARVADYWLDLNRFVA